MAGKRGSGFKEEDGVRYKAPEVEKLDEVPLDDTIPEQKIRIGADLAPDLRQMIISLLFKYKDCFAWSHRDMVGISPEIITHKLNVDPEHPPVKQKRRKFAPERNKVVNDEVQSLLQTGKIREVAYPDWLANVVVVSKKNGKWRVCIAQRIHFHYPTSMPWWMLQQGTRYLPSWTHTVGTTKSLWNPRIRRKPRSSQHKVHIVTKLCLLV